VLSALGLAIADIRRDYVAPLFGEISLLDPARLAAAWEALAGRAHEELRGFPTEPHLDRLADLRYKGQSFELTVAGDTPAVLAEAFHEAHRRRYGHREDGEPVQVVNVRLVATIAGQRPAVIEPEPPEAGARISYRDLLLDGAWVRADVLDRGLMGRGSAVRAPAVVEFAEATCLVRPGWTGIIDAVGTLILTRAHS
jgi:N-methylhydantoinase A